MADTYYTTIHKLPFVKFTDLACDNDLSALVIEGNPSPALLSIASAEIMEQWEDTIGGQERTRVKSILAELSRLKVKSLIVTETIRLLTRYYAPQLVTKLNKLLLCDISLDPAKPAEYDKNLNRFLTRCNGIDMQAKLKEAELSRITKGKEESTAPKGYSREYFTGLIVSLSQWGKYEIDETKTTAGRIAESVKRYKDYVKSISNKPLKK